MGYLKPILLCLVFTTLAACDRPAAPLTPEAVREINASIDGGAAKTQLGKTEFDDPERYKVLGRHMKKAFDKAGYDADKTLQALLAGDDTPEKRTFARQSGLYRIMDSLAKGNRAEIDAWIESGIVSPQTAQRFAGPAPQSP